MHIDITENWILSYRIGVADAGFMSTSL